jgi:hypothetical protein
MRCKEGDERPKLRHTASLRTHENREAAAALRLEMR